MLHVLNKIDALPEAEREALQARVANVIPGSIFVSAITPGGLEPLRKALAEALRRQRPLFEIRIPASDGKMLAEIHRFGEVLDQRTEDELTIVQARLDEKTSGRLRRAGARLTVMPSSASSVAA